MENSSLCNSGSDKGKNWPFSCKSAPALRGGLYLLSSQLNGSPPAPEGSPWWKPGGLLKIKCKTQRPGTREQVSKIISPSWHLSHKVNQTLGALKSSKGFKKKIKSLATELLFRVLIYFFLFNTKKYFQGAATNSVSLFGTREGQNSPSERRTEPLDAAGHEAFDGSQGGSI